MTRVRTTRAYLAGFGTAGSLLAGAAVLFLVASAFVSFHGLSEIVSGAQSARVTLPGSDAAGTPDARVTPSPRVLAAFIPSPAALVTGTRAPSRPASSPPVVATPRGPGAPPTGSSSAPAPTAGSHPSPVAAPTPTTTEAVGVLGNTVEGAGVGGAKVLNGTGAALSGAVDHLGSGLDRTLAPVSPGLAAGAGSLTRSVGTLLTNATGALATLLSRVTGGLGETLGGAGNQG